MGGIREALLLLRKEEDALEMSIEKQADANEEILNAEQAALASITTVAESLQAEIEMEHVVTQRMMSVADTLQEATLTLSTSAAKVDTSGKINGQEVALEPSKPAT